MIRKEKNEEKPKFYNGKYDAVFKNAVVYDEEVFPYFLENALKEFAKSIKSYSIKSSELPKSNYKVRSKTLDVLVKTDTESIVLEINSEHYDSLPIRNYTYLSSVFSNSVFKGDSYDKTQLHILLNVTWGMSLKKDLITDYYVQSDKGVKYLDKVIIREINMDKLLRMWYDKDREALSFDYYLMLGLDKEELASLCKERKIKCMDKYRENVEKLNNDPDFIQVIDPEKDAEMVMNTIKNEARAKALAEGLAEGKEKGITETAKNMLKKDIDIKTISECTGLSEKEIRNLK